MATVPAIAIRGLRKSYGAREVLRGIDLTIEPGTVFGYVGPNGAGKTTTVKILCGMLEGFEGDARVAGHDVRAAPLEVKRAIGYVAETPALYGSLTAFEHLQLVSRLRELPEAAVEGRAMRLLQAFGLGERAHAALSEFSKGMRQKVAIAAALLHDPQVLFLDEPLSGLDVASTLLVKDLVRGLAEEGRTVFYCSHMMDVVERVCDRIVILDGGRIAGDGSFAELVEGDGGATLEDVFRRLTGGARPGDETREILAAIRGGNVRP